MTVPDVVITHGGIFHADDVFACAFIAAIRKRHNMEPLRVIRIPNIEKLPEALKEVSNTEVYIVVDIGGGEFDHHTPESKRYRLPAREGDTDIRNRKPYASFGLVVDAYGGNYFPSTKVQEIFDALLCVPIDMSDECGSVSGGVTNYLSEATRFFNPTWLEMQYVDDKDAAMMEGFDRAIAMAVMVIERYFNQAIAIASGEDVVDTAYNAAVAAGRHWIEMPFYVNYQSHLRHISKNEMDWAMYPSARGGYQIYSVLRGDQPQRLLSAEEMAHLKEDPDLVFVHPNGFTAVFKTPEAAYIALDYLERNTHGPKQ